MGRLGAMSAEVVFAERLAAWGLKGEEVANAMKVADVSFQAGLAGREVNAIFDKSKSCQEIEASFIARASSAQLDSLDQYKKNYKVFGQVMQVSEKEKKVMEIYFQKMYDKQLSYSFLTNNCS